MRPENLAMLVLFFLLLVAIIAFGSGWVKAGEIRAREERRRLREMVEERKRNQAGDA